MHSVLIAEGIGSSRQQWGGPADNKVDSGWGRGENSGGSGDRWMSTGGIGGSAHQRSGGGAGYGSNVPASGVSGNMYLTSGTSQSSNLLMGSGGMSRQQENRFNIAAITARRF